MSVVPEDLQKTEAPRTVLVLWELPVVSSLHCQEPHCSLMASAIGHSTAGQSWRPARASLLASVCSVRFVSVSYPLFRLLALALPCFYQPTRVLLNKTPTRLREHNCLAKDGPYTPMVGVLVWWFPSCILA